MDHVRHRVSTTTVIDTIDDCFVDPFDVYEALRISADRSSEIHFENNELLENDFIPATTLGRLASVEQCVRFTTKLQTSTRIYRDGQTYHLAFLFSPSKHESGSGGNNQKTTTLFRGELPVLKSVSTATYSSSMTDTDDITDTMKEQTHLLSDDPLAKAIFQILKSPPQKPR